MRTPATSRIVSFPCAGFQLYGTLHQPPADAPRSDLAVVVLNQGPLDRSGAHRISVQLARRWANLGVTVLRFDARGVGESEGDWTEPAEGSPVRALYKLVEEGGWVEDTHAAVDFVVKETRAKRVLLAGLCGGGSTAMHSAAHPAVDGVITVGMPVRLGAEITGVSDLVDEKLRSETKGYIRKLLAPTSWKRFLTMQSDYRVLWGVFSTRLRRFLSPKQNIDPRLNARMIRSFEAVAQQKRVHFVYPEKDYLWVEFQELFLPRFPQRKFGFELATIPNANHTFTEYSWQEALFEIVDAWVAKSAAVGAAA